MTITEAYEKYKHMDEPFSKESYGDSFRQCVIHDLWLAIKEEATRPMPEK